MRSVIEEGMNHRALAAVLAIACSAPLTGCVPLAGCGDGNLEPFVGTWELHRTLDASTDCPAFATPATASVGIERDAVDGFLVDSPDLIGAVTYEEPLDGAYGTLRFSLSETWTGADGVTESIVDYELTDDGYSIMGVAHAQLGACRYDWSIHSI